MKILFVWSGLSGYMGDCWRELARTSGVELKVAVDSSRSLPGGHFDVADVMRDLDWGDKLPDGWAPDIVFSVGWCLFL